MTSLRLYSSLLAGTAIVAATGAYCWARLRRKTPEQREYERRQRLRATGRITDGTVLDMHEIAEEGQPAAQLLIYTYDVGGVSYECSQDVSTLRQAIDVNKFRIGLPASIKYDPQNPGNSIVVAEGWLGMRH
jgi:hypothetical protein